jgi:hypothetical protein
MVDFVGAQIDQFIYSLYEQIATVFWIVVKAILYAAYFLMELTAWVTGSVFSPLIGTTFQITGGMLAPIVLIATLLLAIGYFLSVWGDFRVVEFRSGFMWLLISVFIFSVGPSFYEGIESFRRGFGASFYESGLAQISAAQATIGGLDNFDSDDSIYMEPVINYLGIYGFSSTDEWIDGIDVVFAFTQSDGCDLFRASSCGPQSAIWASCAAISLHVCLLPTKWYAGSEPYFANTHPATGFPYMTPEERQAAIADASQGLLVVVTALPMSIFALIEQVINFLLALSMGVGYLSLGIAVLFSFFKRTEPITWAVFNLIIELFLQSIMSSLYLSLIVTLLIVAAGIGNGILVIGTSLIGIVLLSVLLISAWNALWSSINRMFGAMSTVTGNNMPQITKVASDFVGGAASATAGAVGAGLVIGRGGSLAQAAGVAMSDNQGFINAARNASFLFPEDSLVGQMATEAYQGGAAGGLFGKPLGAALVPVGEDTKKSGRGTYFDEDGNPYRGNGGGGGDGGDDDSLPPDSNKKIQTSGRVKAAMDPNGDDNPDIPAYYNAETEQPYLGRSRLPAVFRLDAVDDVEFKDGMIPDNLHSGSMIRRDDLQSFKTKDGAHYTADEEAPTGMVSAPEMFGIQLYREKERNFNQSAAGFTAAMGVTQGNLARIDAEYGDGSAPASETTTPAPTAPAKGASVSSSTAVDEYGQHAASSYEPPADLPPLDEYYPDHGYGDYDSQPDYGLPYQASVSSVPPFSSSSLDTLAAAADDERPAVAANIDLSGLTTAIGSILRSGMPEIAVDTPMADFVNQASSMGLSERTASEVVKDVASTGQISAGTSFLAMQDMSTAFSQPIAPATANASLGVLEGAAQQMVTSIQNVATKISATNVNPVASSPSAAPIAAPAPLVSPNVTMGAPVLDGSVMGPSPVIVSSGGGDSPALSGSSDGGEPRRSGYVGRRRKNSSATDGLPQS